MAGTRRIPVFFGAQVECMTCGREIKDPLVLEEWGRYCSPRCHFQRDLPVLPRRAA